MDLDGFFSRQSLQIWGYGLENNVLWSIWLHHNTWNQHLLKRTAVMKDLTPSIHWRMVDAIRSSDHSCPSVCVKLTSPFINRGLILFDQRLIWSTSCKSRCQQNPKVRTNRAKVATSTSTQNKLGHREKGMSGQRSFKNDSNTCFFHLWPNPDSLS